MKKALLLLLLATGMSSCNAQPKQIETRKQMSSADNNRPQLNWQVNRKYDDKGNLIGYDSTYTWIYSSKGGEVHSAEADSVMSAFRKQFKNQLPSYFNPNFGDPLGSDSLLYQGFILPGFISKKWQEQYFNMERMMKQIDSMRHSFLQRNYPEPNISKRQL